MEAEQSMDLAHRAAVHGALSDPARLAIVDGLVLGDASPSELQLLLGVPSNLLAHHVKVLERVGLVRRSRSEGDQRRTYLRLVDGALNGLVPVSVSSASRVVFVCTHNSARSQLAAALWVRQSRIPVTSAGTLPAERIHPGVFAVAQRHGLSLRRVRPRHVDEVVDRGDFVVTVCDAAHEQLGETLDRVHWSIPDPLRSSSDEVFDRVFDELSWRVGKLADHLDVAK